MDRGGAPQITIVFHCYRLSSSLSYSIIMVSMFLYPPDIWTIHWPFFFFFFFFSFFVLHRASSSLLDLHRYLYLLYSFLLPILILYHQISLANIFLLSTFFLFFLLSFCLVTCFILYFSFFFFFLLESYSIFFFSFFILFF